MYEGHDIIDLTMTRIGQPYVLGAKVHLANANWSGPWDCAEFVSWGCYHAYRQVIAVRPPNIQVGESYSGWWHEDTASSEHSVSVATAIGTPGAILVRRPGYAGMKIGHVAISRGDNTTIEAHSAKVGVAVREDANAREWSGGFLVPGVAYEKGSGHSIKLSPPKKLLRLTSPYMRGSSVLKVQQALVEAGIDPGPLDGIFGNATAVAVAAFQASRGLLVDGAVGSETRKSLGI